MGFWCIINIKKAEMGLCRDLRIFLLWQLSPSVVLHAFIFNNKVHHSEVSGRVIDSSFWVIVDSVNFGVTDGLKG